MTPEEALALAQAESESAADLPAFSGRILPISRETAGGNVDFDLSAGLTGAIGRAVSLPSQVYQGQIDPMSPEGRERALEMAMTVAPTAPRGLPGVALRKPNVPAPSAEALREAGGAGYDAARAMGVDYRADAVGNVAAALRTGLENDGILAELAPKSFSILGKLESPPAGSVAPLAGLDAARRALGHAAKDFGNPTEQLAAQRLIGGLDEFIAKSDPASVVAGPAAGAARTYADARGNYAAAMRSDKLTGLEDTAVLRTGAANSGANIDNAIRSRVATLLSSPKNRAGYSADEIAALEEVAKGTATRNTVRRVGNMLGGGGGVAQALMTVIGGAGGAAAGGIGGAGIGAAMPLILGSGARSVANALTRRSLGRADEAVRKRSPLYSERLDAAPMTAVSPEGRAAIVRALMMSEQPRTPMTTTEEYERFLAAGGA